MLKIKKIHASSNYFYVAVADQLNMLGKKNDRDENYNDQELRKIALDYTTKHQNYIIEHQQLYGNIRSVVGQYGTDSDMFLALMLTFDIGVFLYINNFDTTPISWNIGQGRQNISLFYRYTFYDSVVEVPKDTVIDPELQKYNIGDKSALEGIKTIVNLKKKLESADKYTTGMAADGENIIVFAGTSGSGKSTLINHVMRNKLKVVLKTDAYSLAAEDPSRGPKIVETSKLTKWKSNLLPKKTILDIPGFDTLGGIEQDITNAFRMVRLLKTAESVQFVLVADFNDLRGNNIKSFTNLLVYIHNLFPAIADNLPGISIVFTKYEMDFQGRPEKDPKDIIVQLLETKIIKTGLVIKQNETENKEVVELVRYFINHPSAVSVFKAPVDEKNFKRLTKENDIVATIQQTNAIDKKTIQNIKPSISMESKVFLQKNSEYIFKVTNIAETIDRIEEIYSYTIKSINDESFLKTQKEHIDKLSAINNAERRESKSQNKIVNSEIIEAFLNDFSKTFRGINPAISELIEYEISPNIGLLKFLEQLMPLHINNIFMLNLSIALNGMKQVVNETIWTIKSNKATKQDYLKHEVEQKVREEKKERLVEEVKIEEQATERIWGEWTGEVMVTGAKVVTDTAVEVILQDVPRMLNAMMFTPEPALLGPTLAVTAVAKLATNLTKADWSNLKNESTSAMPEATTQTATSQNEEVIAHNPSLEVLSETSIHNYRDLAESRAREIERLTLEVETLRAAEATTELPAKIHKFELLLNRLCKKVEYLEDPEIKEYLDAAAKGIPDVIIRDAIKELISKIESAEVDRQRQYNLDIASVSSEDIDETSLSGNDASDC